MAHESLRPYCETAGDVYSLLERLQVRAAQSIGARALGCIACLAWGLIDPGPAGKAALCLAAAAGLATIGAMADHVARGLLLHLVDLHDLIRPRDAAASVLVDSLLTEYARQAEEAAPDQGVTH